MGMNLVGFMTKGVYVCTRARACVRAYVCVHVCVCVVVCVWFCVCGCVWLCGCVVVWFPVWFSVCCAWILPTTVATVVHVGVEEKYPNVSYSSDTLELRGERGEMGVERKSMPQAKANATVKNNRRTEEQEQPTYCCASGGVEWS